MWINISNIYINGINIDNIIKLSIDKRNRMRIISNEPYNNDAYILEPLICIILHYYMHTKNQKNRLIDIRNENYHNKIYINNNKVSEYIATPIFNTICNYIICKTNNFDKYKIPSIDKLHFLPNIIIDKKLFSKKLTDKFNIKLFDYQKRTIMRMMEIEKGTNIDFDANYNIQLGEHNILWDPYNEVITDSETKCIVRSKGGILADTMGLGKTITTIGLIHYGNIINKQEFINNKISSRASLIIVPCHLVKQWVDEYMKAHGSDKKIVVILTKILHDKTTYMDIIEADIVIVSTQFLLNIKGYALINYDSFSTLTHFSSIDRLKLINDKYLQIKATNYKILTKPLFEYFHFNRIIIDEGHEIMESMKISYRVSLFMQTFLKNINSNYKWYISGTPFRTYEGFCNILNYLDIYITFDDLKNIIINKITDNTIDINIDNIVYNNIYPFIGNEKFLLKLLNIITIRHLKADVIDIISLPGYTESIEWVELTKSERNIYETKVKNSSVGIDRDRIILQQICCHPLISDGFKKICGNDPLSLEDVQDKLIAHHNEAITTYTSKIEKLDHTNRAYHMLLNTYNIKITESKYIINTLTNIIDIITTEDNCVICFDNIKCPTITPCGHVFCKTCIDLSMKYKQECPMCKKQMSLSELILVEKIPSIEQEEYMNPLVAKYGAKIGKLIQMVRTVLSQDARIIIFSQWNDMLLLIRKSLSETGIDCSFISGNVYNRNKAISRFKLGGENNSVILLSLEKSASGTNLTEASHIFFVEPIDATKEKIQEIESQAIGRAVRMGQKHIVKIIRILCKNTIEEEIYTTKYN